VSETVAGLQIAFHPANVRHMKFRILAAILALGASAFGSSQKPKVTVRFHAEVNPNDGTSFAMPVNLQYARRAAHVARVPAFSEKQIRAIYPFQADDGTWGCFFQLDDQGRIRLETMSSEQMHTALVLFVGTKTGQHQVIDMLIDKTISTGAITVPRGMTAAEVVVLKQQFPVIGEEKNRKKVADPKPKKVDPSDFRAAREGDLDTNYPKPKPLPLPPEPAPQRKVPGPPAVPRDKLNDLDLPRLRD
jgi:hypothetical protein